MMTPHDNAFTELSEQQIRELRRDTANLRDFLRTLLQMLKRRGALGDEEAAQLRMML